MNYKQRPIYNECDGDTDSGTITKYVMFLASFFAVSESIELAQPNISFFKNILMSNIQKLKNCPTIQKENLT